MNASGSNRTGRTFERRKFLAGSVAITACLTRSHRGLGSESSVVQTISLDRASYCGWPTLAKRRNGELVVAYSGGRQAHVCPFGRVDLIRSSDNGQTWTWPRTLLDGPIDDRDAGVVETAKGSLLVTTFTSLAYEPELIKAQQQGNWSPDRLARWQAAHRRVTADERKADLGVWMIRSTDGGRTWSARSRCIVNSPHGPVQLEDGRLIYAGKQLWTDGNRIGVAESKDDGQSWSWLAEIPTRAGDDHTEYHELHVVQSASGRLICHIRNHNSSNAKKILQSDSLDGGASWSEPRAINVWGLPSHLLRLRDDRLLMSYGYRRKPYGNQARISNDDGATWSAPITISDDGTSYDLGYPSTVQLEDDSLYSVWYERVADSPLAVLRGRRWRVD